jgi:protein-L-isoaspartate(D-aspartate) O-methyltransferase
MAEIDFIPSVHQSTSRNYLERMVEHDKAKAATLAKQWSFDYWDGDRSTGYGGYAYDGRWRPVAEAMAAHYRLGPESRILDVGCGKAFLLYEFTQVVPGISVAGIDISAYAIENGKPEIRANLEVGNANALPYPDNSFDLVYSLNTIHNLPIFDLFRSLREIERVGARDKYVVSESYRTEQEKVNLMCWQLTCEAFFRPEEWRWVLDESGYTGDYGFIYFE